MLLTDKFGRAITDLRISITDRCNYKCVYCRTGNEGALYGELPFADYLRMARVLVSMGITKIRLTGGEPLLRRGVVDFVRELAQLNLRGLKPKSFKESNGTVEAMPFHDPKRTPGSSRVASSGNTSDGDESLDIAITTNGHLLAGMAQSLKDAGLNRIT